MSIDNEKNFEKLLLTNLVIYFQFLLLKWRIYLYIQIGVPESGNATVKYFIEILKF